MRLLLASICVLTFCSCGGDFDQARRHFENQQFNDAISELNWVLFMKMADVEALQLRAMSHEALEEYDEALTDYKRILQLKPRDGKAHAGIGKIYWEQKEYKHAEMNLLLAAKEDPENVDLLILLSRAMMKNENYRSADEFLKSARDIDEKNASIYFYRGIVQANLGDPMSTASQFNMYIMYAKDNLKAYYNRGFAYMRMGMTDWAKEDFDFVLEKKPDHYEALARRAVCSMDSNPGQACLDLHQAAKNGSKYAQEKLELCQ
ncbi:tetratricopeptide repeat protein [Echinicola rosea]|uniref:Tetratricopeptide repeat protein n=1 Tax=Echinicola rosea TaxID=1807691 RepID=A0ABQ1V3T5_9BACT|nr:tetratricopeptide repeat protein [Echinicola rosea]GGF37666.1 hypothetical protein GCM10011339_27810 [Echinicola rosea]